MKINTTLQPRSTLEEFADKHGLVMEVNERPPKYNLPPFYASFKGVEITDGSFLRSAFGNGEIPEEAIADYIIELSENRIVVDAYKETRREINVPILINGET